MDARNDAAETVANKVRALRAYRGAQRVAAYLAFDGELDMQPLLRMAWADGKDVYVPILRKGQPMRFSPLRPDSPMAENHFRIAEPQEPESSWIDPHHLDLVLTPLVAFDAFCTRMGMGGGFYDRSFAYRLVPDHLSKPCLLGVAFELQRHPELPRRPWDIPLDAVITEQHLYRGDSDVLVD